MPSFSSAIETKIAALRALFALRKTLSVYELVKIAWSGDPLDTVYYCTLKLDEQSAATIIDEDGNPISPVEVRLTADDNNPAWFIPVKLDASIGDEEIDLELWDGDGVISDNLVTFGEGGNVELLYWIVSPGVSPTTLLLPVWNGHLEFGDGSDGVTMKIKAANGMRSNEEDLPDRGATRYCQAVFGGLFTTDEEALAYGPDCPYNLNRGGDLGTNDPDTGLPWTFCDRLDIQSCIDRGVTAPSYVPGPSDKAFYHLSHRTIEATVVNNQTKGPRLLETSHGNEGNLSEPMRVIMGIRRVYGIKLLVSRRDRNTKNPDQGFFQGIYGDIEGPIVSFQSTNVTVGGTRQPVQALHYGERLGEIGQSPVADALTPHSFSGTPQIRYAFGWVDPDQVSDGDANADSLVTGLRDIRVYYEAGNGLVGDYYRYTGFYDRMGRRIDATINFASNFTGPIQGQFSDFGFCMEWNGYISFQYLETYTITTINDNDVTVWIEDVELTDTPILTASYPSTGSGTYTPPAINTQIPIRIRFIQQPDPPPGNLWTLILKWQSASRSLQVVPTERLFHDLTYQTEFTRNRVWQIARMMTDKRWGGSWDYEDFNLATWMDAAEWVDEQVTFTDPFGTEWPHIRALSDVELVGRKEQQQVEDMCIAGRLSLPFMFDGKLCIEPLRALTTEELDDAPVFTDVLGDDCNILYEGDPEKSTLDVNPKSIFEIKNQIRVSIDDVAEDYVDTPLRPFEDVGAQIQAGRVRGSHARKVNKQEYKLLGVTMEAQATKVGWSLLDLGPLDRGGLANNLSIKFKIWIADALNIHPWKVIKVVSPDKLARYGFTYFRVMAMERGKDLVYTITAQAYNETYMETFEGGASVSPTDPPGPEPPPEILLFGDLTYENNILTIPIVAP